MAAPHPLAHMSPPLIRAPVGGLAKALPQHGLAVRDTAASARVAFPLDANYDPLVTVDELLATLKEPSPPRGLPPLLRALWLDAHGDWDGAHKVAQDEPSPDAPWVHAYLHRKEGDAGNAAYWYGQASRPVARTTLDDEWRAIAEALLAASEPTAR